jgi:hypothetical protein
MDFVWLVILTACGTTVALELGMIYTTNFAVAFFLLCFGVLSLKSRLWLSVVLVLVLPALSVLAGFVFGLRGALQSHVTSFWGIITTF